MEHSAATSYVQGVPEFQSTLHLPFFGARVKFPLSELSYPTAGLQDITFLKQHMPKVQTNYRLQPDQIYSSHKQKGCIS
jgi:hypothetical protein